MNTSTNDGATVNGSGFAFSSPMDVKQVYLGGSPPPPENSFTRYATGTPPSSPAGDFTRGDALIASLAANTNSSSTVSESYLGTLGTSETGNAGLTTSLSFAPTQAGALTITYNFASNAYALISGNGSVTANFSFDLTIKNLAGAIVFSSATANTNLSLALPPNGVEVIQSGSESVTTGNLNAGEAYTLIFSSSSRTAASLTAVPEPGSLTRMGIGGLGLMAFARLRRRQA